MKVLSNILNDSFLQKISPLEGQGILSEASVAPATDTNTVTDKVQIEM